MKQCIKLHNGIVYRLTLYERARVIMIEKNISLADASRQPNYTIEWATSFWRCSCPGAKYHGNCWHVSVIGELKAMPSINTPEAEWDEEFVKEKIDERILRQNRRGTRRPRQ